MWKNIIIVILLATSIILGVLFYLSNSKIKLHMKDKEDELKKREEKLIVKENCNDQLSKCKAKLTGIKKLVA